MISKSELDIWPVQWLGLHRNYLVDGEMDVLAALLRGVGAETVAEFGCRDGRTARVLMQNVPSIMRYIGVDVPMSYQPGLSHQRSEMVTSPGILAQHIPQFELMIREHGTFDLTPADLGTLDAVFIDGDHSEEVVSFDSVLARTVVRTGGVIIWHDAQNGAVEVRRVLDRLIAEYWPIQNIEGTWLAAMWKE